MWTRSGAAADAVGDRQPPCHAAGASTPSSASRIGRASRHDSGALMIFGSDDRVRRRDPLRAGHRCPAGRERIARHAEVVDDAAALDVAVGPPRTVRVGLAFLEAVFRGIGVDEDARRAALFRRERLEAAIAVRHRVADQDDLAAHVDAVIGEPGVVGRVAAVRRRRPARSRRPTRSRRGRRRRRRARRTDRRRPRLPSSTRATRVGADAVSTSTSIGYGSRTSCSTISTCSRP